MSEKLDALALLESVVPLTKLIGSVLGLERVSDAVIDENVVSLALLRHGVGPLICAAMHSVGEPVRTDLAVLLERSYRENIQQQAVVSYHLQLISSCFEAAGLAWLALKGLSQARLLYDNPGWRRSADIDLLVMPEDFQLAATILEAAGYKSKNPPLPPHGLLRSATLHFIRDVKLVGPDNHNCPIELHQRPFFVADTHTVLPSFVPIRTSGGSLPYPALGTDLAFYLIAHGAESYWSQLKWLVDLVPLFGRISNDEKMAIAERSISTKTHSSIAASLLMFRLLFPLAPLGPISPWLDKMEKRDGVQRRLARYAWTLGSTDIYTRAPAFSRVLALQSSWSLFEAPSARAQLLALAPISLTFRTAAKAGAALARRVPLLDL